MSKQSSMIRVSMKNGENLRILKNELNLPSYDEVISYLINANMTGNSEVNSLVELKKALENGLASNEKRTDAVHKRLGHLDKFYFTKILDTHNLLKEFLTTNVKSGYGQKSTESSDSATNVLAEQDKQKLQNEIKEVWESHREIEQINEALSEQLNSIKNKFKFESGAFSKSYKAVLSVQDYEDIFK